MCSVPLKRKLKDNVSVSFPHLLAFSFKTASTTATLSFIFHKWVKLRANSATMQVSFPSLTVKLFNFGATGTGAVVVTGVGVVTGATVVVGREVVEFGVKVVVVGVLGFGLSVVVLGSSAIA